MSLCARAHYCAQYSGAAVMHGFMTLVMRIAPDMYAAACCTLQALSLIAFAPPEVPPLKKGVLPSCSQVVQAWPGHAA